MLKFGAPVIQKAYEDLCKENNISFDEFQIKIIETTGKSYDELKDYWIDGEETTIDTDELDVAIITNVLFINCDENVENIFGFTVTDEFICKTDGTYFYNEF